MRRAALLVWAVVALARPAEAGRLRVVAGTELRLEPRVRADRRGLEVSVHVRDDRGAPVPGRVSLRASGESGGPATSMAELAPQGDATFLLPVSTDERVYLVHADFAGSDGGGRAHGDARVDLDAPFITLDLRAPPIVDLGGDAVDVVVSVAVGEVVTRSPAGLEVALVANERVLGTALADATGRAAFSVRAAELGAPGVVTLRAEHARAGVVVRSPDRRVVVRARATLALERVSERAGLGPEGDGVLVAGALVSPAGPVAHEPVQILEGSRVLGAALTDGQGIFALRLDPELAARPDLLVHAAFVPTEPWFLPCESEPLRLTAPTPRPVNGWLVAAPLPLAAVLALALLRRRSPVPRVATPLPPLQDAGVERVADGPASVVRVRVVAIDRATQEEIDGAHVRWLVPQGAAPSEDGEVDVAGDAFSVEVSAEGYAPRTFGGALPRGGSFRVRVPLRTWREELFERVRRWMRRSGAVADPALPTPREVLAARGAAPAVERFVEHVEAGAYGAEAPGADAVQRADELSAAADGAARGER